MRKIKLDLEKLSVETFAPADGDRAPRGTVRGRESNATLGFRCGDSTWDSGMEWCVCMELVSND